MKKIYFISFFYFCFFTFALSAQQPTQEWVARYERPSGSSGLANQMALDKIGNCYVFGNVPVSGNFGGMILIKYNQNGDTLWTRYYNQGAGNAARNVNLIADSTGNVYITGRTGIGSFGPYDIVTIKFNPDGLLQWLRIYDTGTSDEPTDITMDKQGNVYICGFSGNESLIIKYNQNGDTVWTRKYTTANYFFAATSITLDIQNNIIIGGSRVHTTNGGVIYFTIKYDSNAVFQWVNTASITELSSFAKVCADMNGNVFATGRSGGQIYTVKYNTIGTLQWQRQYEGLGGENAYDMGIDNIGNILITGTSSGSGTGRDYVTIKYNTIGDSLWVKRYNGTANGNDEAYSLDLDDSDNIYITGRSINTGVSWDYVTIKYTPSGIVEWVSVYNNQPVNAEDVAYKLLLDNYGNVFVTGLSTGFIGGPLDFVTIKYSQTVGIDPSISHIPKNYELFQNYPNPFNPRTKIKYQIIGNNTYLRIIVFDITGKEVAVLVDKIQNIGNYEITFEPANLASGIYFYKLIAKDFTDTKKMVLVK
jgi:hypothetical protein